MAFGNCFRCSAIFLIRKKFWDIDLSDIDFVSIEGNDVLNLDNYIDERFGSELGPSRDTTTLRLSLIV